MSIEELFDFESVLDTEYYKYENYANQIDDILYEFGEITEFTTDSILIAILNLTQNAFQRGGEEGYEQGRYIERERQNV